MNEQTIRAFIAIDPPKELFETITGLLTHLKNKHTGAKIKWVKHDNLHMTIRFIGSASEDMINDIHHHVTNIVEQNNHFTLHLKKIIVFPKHHPKIIAIGAELSAELASLVRQIETAMQQLGLTAETRPFLPHITLGRITGHTEFDLAQTERFLPVTFMVEEVLLYKSELHQTGSIYTPLKKFSLKKD